MEFLNIIFIGHVDAGKSTIAGSLISYSEDINTSDVIYSHIFDIIEEEKERGKTIETGKISFKTNKKQYIILDAPGHKSYIPNMINGVNQADVGILIISARIQEFETGFERGGQTREHAILAKASGIDNLIICINKMDDKSVEWDQKRFDEIKSKLYLFIKSLQIKNVYFIPCSGLKGTFITNKDIKCDWYKGPSLLEYLDNLDPISRLKDFYTRFEITNVDSNNSWVYGKVLSGKIQKGNTFTLMPYKNKISVINLFDTNDQEIDKSEAGDNIKILINKHNFSIANGMILCSNDSLCNCSNIFTGKLMLFNLKSIITKGFKSILHLHSIVKEVIIKNIIAVVDKKNKYTKTHFVKNDQTVIIQFECCDIICIEKYSDFQHFGRFSLRYNDKTIGVGKVLKLE